MIELSVATGCAAILFISILVLTVFTARTYSMVTNYVEMDAKSRNTIDTISREIRDSTALLAFSTNNPSYLLFTNATAQKLVRIEYNANTGMVTYQETGSSIKTNLVQCDKWGFELYSRYPDITSTNISFYPCTNSSGVLDPSFCKLVNLSWTCSRKILSSKLNTESVLTAQIVLRNKVK